MRRMVMLLGFLLAAAAWANAAWAGDAEFPYTAYVVSDDVYVRSGPGRNYYPTDKLQKQDEVEVYRHDPGGWCAVRPPEGSFSWVSGRYLRKLEDGLAVITGDDVVARVGSKFSSVRDVMQVRLTRGEKVELIGEITSGGQTWYKIAPPSGEFRWVSSKFLDRDGPNDGVSEPRTSRNERQASHEADEEELAETSEDELDEEDRREIDRRRRRDDAILAAYEETIDMSGDEVEEASEEAPRGKRWRTSQVRPAAAEETVDRPSRSPRTASLAPRREVTRKSKPARALPSNQFEAELADIKLSLSQMIAEEPTVWSFKEQKERLAILADEAATALDRGQVRELELKIVQLESIRNRYEIINEVQADTDRRNGLLGAAGELTGRIDRKTAAESLKASDAKLAAAAASTAPSEFDGEGVLRPVVSKRPDAPRFALVDPTSTVVTFVSPAPGVNLQPYLGQRVGITGTRGFAPALKKPHLTAKRITPLSASTRLQ